MVDFTSVKRLVAKVGGGEGGYASEGKSGGRFGAGISNNGPVNTLPLSEDKFAKYGLILRGVQIFLAAVVLIIAVILASFQSKWIGGPSGLTGLLIAISILSLLTSGIFVTVPLIHSRSDFTRLKSLARALSEARVGFILNGVWVGISLLIALTQTISANVKGCKDPASDAHAKSSKGKEEDFLKVLPGFCNTKRAGAAFIWFLFISWLLALGLFLRSWRLSRKNGPRIPPFVHPTDDSAFEPIQGDDDDDPHLHDANPYSNYGSGGGGGGRYGDGGDGRYGSGAGYDYGSGAGGRDSYGAPLGRPSYSAENPFGDVQAARPSYDYGAYGNASQVNLPGSGRRDSYAPNDRRNSVDPYAAIQNQLQNERPAGGPPQLPPLYQH